MKAGIKKRILLTITVLLFMAAYTMSALAEENDRFVVGTSVNGISLSRLTVEEAKAKMTAYYTSEYRLAVVRKDGITEYITAQEIGYQAGIPDGLQTILDQQNESGRIMGPAAESSHQMAVAGAFDKGALAARIATLDCVGGTGIIPTANANISPYQEGQAFTILPEVYGNSLSLERLTANMEAVLTSGQLEFKLADTNSYDTVTVTSNDEKLQTLCDLMNQCRDMTITYSFGEGKQEQLAGDVITTWLTGLEADGQIGVNRELAAAYVKSLADKYDTADRTRIFRTTSGRDVEVKGTYGWRISQGVETDALIGMIRTGQNQSREPQYDQAAADKNGPDWGNTYVEIDLTGQHVYMYKDGVLAWDAPCVTGNVSKNHTTPPGIFTLTYKEEDRVLRGKKMPDGTYEYESPVDYWMPFNGGIGLHDANWRGSFGGNIYKTNGSHGCINLPPAKAKILYGLVYKGIPVICYN